MKIIEDVDTLYKFTGIDRLFEMLDKKAIAFLPPQKYNSIDKFEGFLFNKLCKERKKRGSNLDKFSYLNYKVFYQCLTSDQETDQIWKTYTPEKMGVRIKFSIGKLKKHLNDNYFLYKVKYRTKQTIKKLIKEYLKMQDPTEDELIKLFIYKMKGFKKDDEFRLLTVDKEVNGEIKYVEFNHDLIEDLLFDPRMEPNMLDVFREILQNHYNIPENKIQRKRSDLYNPDERFKDVFEK